MVKLFTKYVIEKATSLRSDLKKLNTTSRRDNKEIILIALNTLTDKKGIKCI